METVAKLHGNMKSKPATSRDYAFLHPFDIRR